MSTGFDPSSSVDIAQESGKLILRLHGELDFSTRDVMETAILAAIPTAYEVTLDLRDLTFCDSTGLAMFLAAKDAADANGTVLKLVNPQPIVARVFSVTGVGQVFGLTG